MRLRSKPAPWLIWVIWNGSRKAATAADRCLGQSDGKRLAAARTPRPDSQCALLDQPVSALLACRVSADQWDFLLARGSLPVELSEGCGVCAGGVGARVMVAAIRIIYAYRLR